MKRIAVYQNWCSTSSLSHQYTAITGCIDGSMWKDICKRDLKDCNIDPANLQTTTSDRNKWRLLTKQGCRQSEERKTSARRKKKEEKKQTVSRPEHQFACTRCGRACHSRIGLFSHSKRCMS